MVREITPAVTVTIGMATPRITWTSPADITYGTALGTTQLDATTTVAGAFSYTPPAGTVLGVGDDQTLSATFTPTDSADYTNATATVAINVDRAAPQVSVNPVNLTYGTALANSQLSGMATATSSGNMVAVPGSFSYTSAAGTVLGAGAGQSESVTFTPTDASGYSTAVAAVIVNVAQAPLTITADSQTKTYGGAVTFGTEFVAKGLVNGDHVTSVTLSSPGAAATAGVSGSPYPIVPSAAVGTGLSNYSITYEHGTLTVNPAALTITANDITIAAGQSIPSFAVQYSGFVPGQGPSVLSGTLSLGSSANAGRPPGPYPIVPSGLTSSNYAITYVTGTLTITMPFVTVTGVQWETLKVSRKQSARELVVSFSGGLNSADADDLAAYALDSAKRVKKSTVYTKPVPLASALYNAGANTVTLRLRGKPPAQTMQLTVKAALVLDAEGRPLAGNGQPGGNFVATLRGGGS